MKIRCKLCGKEVKHLVSHLNNSHDKLSLEDYNSVEVQNTGDTFETDIESEKFDYKEARKKVFSVEDDTFLEMTMRDFLKKYDIESDDLMSLVRGFKDGVVIPISKQIKNKMSQGEKKAEELAQTGDKVFANDVATAEFLVKNHGYTVKEVRSGNPRTWVLSK